MPITKWKKRRKERKKYEWLIMHTQITTKFTQNYREMSCLQNAVENLNEPWFSILTQEHASPIADNEFQQLKRLIFFSIQFRHKFQLNFNECLALSTCLASSQKCKCSQSFSFSAINYVGTTTFRVNDAIFVDYSTFYEVSDELCCCIFHLVCSL